MAKNGKSVDENGNPIPDGNDYSHLPSVSDVLAPKDAGEITYKLEDVQNRQLVIVDATLEAGTYGSYASILTFDPATKQEKRVTSGSTMIMTQVSALINAGAIPCRVKIMKLGKTWCLQ